MPLVDQIVELGMHSSGELARLRAYYEHTKFVWRLAQELAEEGREIGIQSPVTGQILEPSELYKLSQDYVTEYLAESVLDKTVSLFEDFLFGLLEVWLTAHPLGIRHKDRQVSLRVVLDAQDKEAIIRHIIDKELDELKYEHISRWFKFLDGRVELGVPTDDQIAALAELKGARDILVHQAGVINETYVRKAGSAARYEVGDRVEIREPYLYDSWSLVESVFREMTAAAIGKA